MALPTKKEASRLLKLLAGGLAATILPRRFDSAAADRLLRMHPSTQPAKLAELNALIREVLPSRGEGNWSAIVQEHARMSAEHAWGRYRGVGLRGWHPAIEFSGEDHVRAALQQGRGAVMWCMRFASDIVLKQAFHRAGIPLFHLSDVAHGLQEPPTEFATAVISPIFRRAEDPYLAGRILIPKGGGLGYLETLRDHLRANHCVSIFADATGRQVVEAPFLNGYCGFATGAPSMAWAEDSALLPVYTQRTGPFQYRVVVDEPIPVDRSVNRKDFVKGAVNEFARRMERLVEQHPSDWQDWLLWKRSQEKRGDS